MSAALHNGNEYHIWFDSMEELIEDIKKMNSANSIKWAHSMTNSHSARSNLAWIGVASKAEAVRKITGGWPELLERLQPMIEHLRSTLQLDSVTSILSETRRRKRHRSDYGDTLDMHRVWTGHLDTAWERPTSERRMAVTQKYASIYCDVGVRFVTNFEETLWRAAAAICIVDTLNRMAINTEVWVGSSACPVFVRGPMNAWTAVKVKEFTQPVTEERFAAMFCATFHRTFGFAMRMCGQFEIRSDMGYSTNTGMPQMLRDRKAAGERVFRMGECLNQVGAEREIQAVIDALKPSTKEAA